MVKLSDYEWGFGIEHEMHIFHLPSNSKKPIKDVVLFNSEEVKERLLSKDIDIMTKSFIESVPYEKTGRKCSGHYVITPVGCLMPEFISSYPITSLKKGRYIQNMVFELKEKTRKYLELLSNDELAKKQIKKYGKLSSYPFSMTSHLREPENPKAMNYKLMEPREEYLGSYHITVTLPHLKSIKLNNFIKLHQNFANQLQWMEPLLMTSFFSADQRCVGTKDKRVKGSYRVMMIGWGNFAGSDLRKLANGIGRYSNIKSYWRKNLNFTGLKKLEPCYKPSPVAKREKALSALSSDFRTVGAVDEENPVAKMTVSKGIEFRIFDNFDDKYIEDLCRLIVLFAENSRVHKTKEYVYDNKLWNDAMHTIMKDGWKGILSEDYIDLLRKHLNLKIKCKTNRGYDILDSINEELYKKHSNGDFTKIMTGYLVSKYNKELVRKPILPKINRQSINMSICLKFNNDTKAFNNFIKFINKNVGKTMDKKEYTNEFYKYFDKDLYKNNLDDIIYFLEDYHLLTVNLCGNKVDNVKFTKNKLKIKNMNEFIRYIYNYSNIYNVIYNDI